jgi:hypothetical protein
VIQFYSGDVVVLGITRANVEKLTSGQPIMVSLASPKRPSKVAIVFGETKLAILADMEKAGMDVPQAVKDAVAQEPS